MKDVGKKRGRGGNRRGEEGRQFNSPGDERRREGR